MIIGLDLDGSLIYNTIDVVNLAAKNLGLEKYSVRPDYYFSTLMEEHRKEILRLFLIPEIMCKNMLPFPGTVEKLQEWKDKKYKIVIISAREKPVYSGTHKMIKELFANLIDTVHFTGNMWGDKKELMLKEKIEIWIDDAPHGIQTSLDLGIETFMIHNSYSFYNKDVIGTLIDKNHVIETIADLKI